VLRRLFDTEDALTYHYATVHRPGGFESEGYEGDRTFGLTEVSWSELIEFLENCYFVYFSRDRDENVCELGVTLEGFDADVYSELTLPAKWVVIKVVNSDWRFMREGAYDTIKDSSGDNPSTGDMGLTDEEFSAVCRFLGAYRGYDNDEETDDDWTTIDTVIDTRLVDGD